MTISKGKTLISALKQFRNELKSYKSLLDRLNKKQFIPSHEIKNIDRLREKLVRKTGALKIKIIELTGKEYISQSGITYNIWDVGLTSYSHRISSICDVALDYCIDAVNEAIGKLEIQPLAEIEANTLKETEMPIFLFDAMRFHPKVIEASRACFITGNYRGATIDTFISLVDYVKEKTGLDLDGDNLMNQVFSFDYDKKEKVITRYPMMRINELKNQSNRDEQLGFMYLCKGAAIGIRNPKVHKLIPQSNPFHTLEYLALASLIFRRIEEGKLEKKEPT